MSKKILVVDDSATIRQNIRASLEEAGFQVVEACDGVDGIEKIQLNGDVALVISDVNMPRMNGLEMVEQIRRQHTSLPIVMLTTEGQPDLIRRAQAAGAKGWIVKPFKPRMLVTAVQQLTASA